MWEVLLFLLLFYHPFAAFVSKYRDVFPEIFSGKYLLTCHFLFDWNNVWCLQIDMISDQAYHSISLYFEFFLWYRGFSFYLNFMMCDFYFLKRSQDYKPSEKSYVDIILTLISFLIFSLRILHVNILYIQRFRNKIRNTWWIFHIDIIDQCSFAK